MCLEHKQYWQCCTTVDSKYIDPCPIAESGVRCNNKEQRIHPIGGHCSTCQIRYNKCEDDPVVRPMLARNDSYEQPWKSQQTRHKVIKSQPLSGPIPAGHQIIRDQSPSLETERGRRTRRAADVSPGPAYRNRQNYSFYYTERPQTPPRSRRNSSSKYYSDDNSDEDFGRKVKHQSSKAKSKSKSKPKKKGSLYAGPLTPSPSKSRSANSGTSNRSWHVVSPSRALELQSEGRLSKPKGAQRLSTAEVMMMQLDGHLPPTRDLEHLEQVGRKMRGVEVRDKHAFVYVWEGGFGIGFSRKKG